ncbi:metallophosphoesterase family protein [Bacteroidota bacterium]
MSNRLFAIGDIHGCFDSLKELLEHKIQLKKTDKLILLGDYIDRGTKSREVVDFIMALQENGYSIEPILGNHESMLLDAHENNELLSRWIQNGGTETLNSFGIKSLESLESKYLNFFKSLQPFFKYQEYLFVHAGFNDELDNPFDDSYHMIWKSREKYANPLLKNKVIVHGHYPIPIDICEARIKNKNRVINLDTGCVYSNKIGLGRLTALELNSGRMYFV